MKIAYILALFPALAMANGPKTPEKPVAPKAEAEAAAQASAESSSQSASNASADNSVRFSDRLQAPASFSPSIAPTAPCYYSASGGLSVPGFGASAGKAVKDESCENRENIRLAYQMGLQAEADFLFCSTIGKDIPNCGKRPVLTCEKPDCLTQDDLAERWKRIQESALAK